MRWRPVILQWSTLFVKQLAVSWLFLVGQRWWDPCCHLQCMSTFRDKEQRGQEEPWLLINTLVIGYWLFSASFTLSEGNALCEHYLVWDWVLFSAKSHFRMEDLVSESTCRGVIGQSRTDELPPSAALSVDSSCGSCLKSIKRWVPLDYKHEMVQLLKLAGPVVRLCSADKVLPCLYDWI